MTTLIGRTFRKEVTTLRDQLKDALKRNDSDAIDDVQCRLLALTVPLKAKCQYISINPIVKNNCKDPSKWDAASMALGILEKYAANLLRPEAERPKGWESIATKNEVFSKRVHPIVGTRHILGDIGYTETVDDVIKIRNVPNEEKILSIRADLKIAKCEIDLYRTKSHPFPEQMDAMVKEEARIDQDPEKQRPFKQQIDKITADKAAASNPQPTNPEPVISQAPPTLPKRSRPSPSKDSPPPESQAGVSKQVEAKKMEAEASASNFPLYPRIPQAPPIMAPPSLNPNMMSSMPYSPDQWPPYSMPRYIMRAPNAPPGQSLHFGPPMPMYQPMNYYNQFYRPEQPPPYSMCQPPHVNSPYGPYQMNARGPPRMAWGPAEHSPQALGQAPVKAEALPAKPIQDPVTDPAVPSAPRVYPSSTGNRGQSAENVGSSQGPAAGEAAAGQSGIPGEKVEKPARSIRGKSPLQRGKLWSKRTSEKSSNESRIGSFWKWVKGWVGSSDEKDTSLERGVEATEQALPGVKCRMPRSYNEILLKEPDEKKRFGKLETIIEVLEHDAGVYEEEIENIIAEKDDYKSDEDYKRLTDEKDDLKKELILLKRVRDDILTRRPEAASRVKKERWACKFCTFLNPMDENICGACAKTAEEKVAVEEEEEEFVLPPEEPQISPPPVVPVATGPLDDVDVVMNWMKEADDKGFTVHQFNFALKVCEDSGVSPVDWLNQNWLIIVEYVMVMLTNNHAQLGQFSKEEVIEALKDSGNADDAVKKCVKERNDMLAMLVRLYPTIPPKALLKEIVDEKGKEADICRRLNDEILKPLVREVSAIEAEKNLLDNRVDGDIRLYQIIRNKNLNIEDRLVTLMVEGRVKEEVAELALNLVETYLDEETMDNITYAELIDAAKTGALDLAFEYLKRECPLCFCILPESRMMSLITCQCKFCRACGIEYFLVQIRSMPANSFNCPCCQLPDLYQESEERALYRQMLSHWVHHCLPLEDVDLFEKKLLDAQLWDDPRFRWCKTDNCNAGFVFEPEQQNRLRMQCPHCRTSTCYQCEKPWAPQHEDITCEEFADWQKKNDPAASESGIEKLLEENGIRCPQCKFRYELARGGCLHFTCVYCKFEFCSGCSEQISRTCRRFASCVSKGFHAHHPRYCLHFLRDESIEVLTKLLENNGVRPKQMENAENSGTCRVMEQKETPTGLQDEPCGKQINNDGLCLNHYREYLVNLLNKHHIDPVVIMEKGRLEGHLREYGQDVPEYAGMSDAEQLQRLRQLVQTQLPLQYK